MTERRPDPTDYGLSPERAAELASAFRGANTLAWLLVFIGVNVLFLVTLSAHLTSLGRWLGMGALSLTSALLVMFFVSGVVKLLLTLLFKRLVPEYAAVLRYERALRDWQRSAH